jgi:hypothetical protein
VLFREAVLEFGDVIDGSAPPSGDRGGGAVGAGEGWDLRLSEGADAACATSGGTGAIRM